MDILEKIFDRKRKMRATKFFSCFLLFILTIIAWILYKTTSISCSCQLHCKGKYCNCDFNKNFSNKSKKSDTFCQKNYGCEDIEEPKNNL